MEAKQFYNRSISPLVIKTFACKWSEDDRLSVVTEKGVNVFSIKPSPTQATPLLSLSRTFINSPESLPGDSHLSDILKVIFDWSKDDVYEFLMNDAFTPTFPKASKMVPEIIDVFWSPQNLLHSHKCLLAVLTSSGAIELAREVDRSWLSVYDFTEEWGRVIEKDLEPIRTEDKLNSHCLRDQLNKLLTTTATWSSLYYDSKNNSYAYFVTAHRNTEIVIWKIERIIDDNTGASVNENVQLCMNTKVLDECIKINSLLWVDVSDKTYLLFLGLYNGQIGLLKLQKENDGKITSSDYLSCLEDEDSILVDSMLVLKQTDEWLELIVVKGMYLQLIRVDTCGKLINMDFVSSPGFSIIGTIIIDCNNILVVTQDGSICMVQKSEDHNKLIVKMLKSDLPQNLVQYLGLATSPNRMILSLITSPSLMYDHLHLREPSTVCFFNFSDVPSLDPVDVLNNNEKQCLTKCWDCLELIKVSALKQCEMPKYVNKVAMNLESLSVYKLKIAYWIMIIKETVAKRNYPEESFSLPEEVEQAKSYIFLYSASDFIMRLADKKELTEIQKLSMSLLRNHLDIWYAGEEEEAETLLTKRVRSVLEVTKKFDTAIQEKCNFCQNLITEPWASICPSGHKLPRCAITRLQVTCTRYRTCAVCQEVFHPFLDSELDEVKCLYCDLPVFYRSQLVDRSILETKRHLSKKPIVATNSKETKEEDDA